MGKEWTVFSEDEFSVDLRTGMSHVWVKKGSKPICPTHTKDGKVHMFGALNNKTKKVITFPCEKIDRFSFLKFLKKILHYYKKIFLVLDNASWHHAKIVREFVEKNKERIQLEYIPPYSPEHNPSEQCWKAVKVDLLTAKLFLSTEGMQDQIIQYFRTKTFPNLHLERFLCP